MLCQNCEKNEATTHVKQIVNGEMTQTHLCRDCVRLLGTGELFSDFNMSLTDLFGGFFDMLPVQSRGAVTRCPKCGCSFDDIAQTGKLGCAECYTTFYDKLLPSLQRIHGKMHHTGKVGAGGSGELTAPAVSLPAAEQKPTVQEKITALQEQMALAVQEQNFELAASLRDEINALKGGNTI